MNRDTQIELLTTAAVRLDERVTAWIATDQVRAAIRANSAMLRDIKNPPPPRAACGR